MSIIHNVFTGFARSLATALLISIPAVASATVIVDLEVEAAGSQTGLNGWYSQGGWYQSPGSADSYFSEIQEGNWITHSNTHYVSNNDVSQGNHTLQAGTYTIQFAAGSYSNAPFSFANNTMSFAGMDVSSAISSSRVNPGPGQWQLWEFTWEVASDSSLIGNALDFYIKGNSSGNAAIDGVGDLSNLGTGFIVDYTSVPAPSGLVLVGLGLLLAGTRRKQRT